MKNLTERQKQIIKKLNHPIYDAEFVESWINRKDNVFINTPAALQACCVKGFFDAVKCIEKNDLDLLWVEEQLD